MKKTLLLFVILAVFCFGFGQVDDHIQAPFGNSQSFLAPVRDLSICVLENDAVQLKWNMPESVANTVVLSQSDDSLANCLYYGLNTIHAHQFDADDLQDYNGWKIESISSLSITSLRWNLYADIWKYYSEDSIVRIYEQGLFEEIPQYEWYTIVLDEPFFIEPNTQYRFGIRTEYPWGGGGRFWSIPLDNKPAVQGKGNIVGNRINEVDDWIYWQNGGNVIVKIVLSSCEDEKAILGVQDSSFPTCYRIYRNGILINQTNSPFQLQYIDTEFTRETDVEYCVTAVYGEEESEPLCATTVITKIEEDLKKEGITVSPNPTNGLIRIEGAEVSEAQVYNTMGQLVKTVENTNEIDLSGLTPSVYSLRIKDTQGVNMNKKVVVKQH